MTSIDGQLNWDRERGFVALGRANARERDPALATIAQLRAFCLLLCVDVKLANELVELTLLRICVATDLSHLNPSHSGWLIGRLRTYFYAEFAHRQAAIDLQPPLPSFGRQLHGDVLERNLWAEPADLKRCMRRFSAGPAGESSRPGCYFVRQ